jgi:hypothetical protein
MMRETIAMLTTSCVVVAARIIFKLFARGQTIWYDDYAIVFLLLFGGIPSMCITVAVLAPAGLGRDIWSLPFENIDTIFRWAFISGVLYFPQVAMLKLTFLFFYLRIFPSRRTKQLIWATIVFCCLFGFVFFFVAIFTCAPIEYWWVWDGSPGGQCLSKDGIQWSSAIISIVVDVWMIAIPLWNVRKLKLHWKKKLGVAAMFLVGSLSVLGFFFFFFLIILPLFRPPPCPWTCMTFYPGTNSKHQLKRHHRMLRPPFLSPQHQHVDKSHPGAVRYHPVVNH